MSCNLLEHKVKKFFKEYKNAIDLLLKIWSEHFASTISEEDLKVAFIEPFLRSLGITPYLASECYFKREYRDSNGKPVDYFVNTLYGSFLIEAKAPKVGKYNFSKGKEFEQLLSYLRYYKINRGFLTNGNEWIVVDLKKKTIGIIDLFKKRGESLESFKKDANAFLNLAKEMLEGKSEISYKNAEFKTAVSVTDGMKKVYTHKKERKSIFVHEGMCESIFKDGVLHKELWSFGNEVIATIARRSLYDKKNVANHGYYNILTKNWYMEIGTNILDIPTSRVLAKHVDLIECLAYRMYVVSKREAPLYICLPRCHSLKELKEIRKKVAERYVMP